MFDWNLDQCFLAINYFSHQISLVEAEIKSLHSLGFIHKSDPLTALQHAKAEKRPVGSLLTENVRNDIFYNAYSLSWVYGIVPSWAE